MMKSMLVSATMVATASLVGCGETERDTDSGSRNVAGVALLDDLEDGNTQSLADEAGYLGFWYAYDDKNECDNPGDPPSGLTSPDPADMDFPMTNYADVANVTSPGIEGSQESNDTGARFSGQDHGLWGAGMGINLAEGAPYDLSAQGFVGLRFWGISPGGEQNVQVKVPDMISNPLGGVCIPRDNALCDTQGCFDDAFRTVTFTSQWQLFKVYFTQTVSDDATTSAIEVGPLNRGGWGSYVEGAITDFDPTQAVQVQFQLPRVPDPGFDIFVDNVGFILAGDVEDVGAVAAATE